MNEVKNGEVTTGLSRRGFLKAGGTAMGAVVLGGLAGCGDDVTKIVKSSTDSGSTTTETLWYGTEPATGTIVEEVTTDILICGLGHGGLNATLASAEAGAKTLAIEKASGPGSVKTYLGAVGTTAQNNAGVNINKGELLNDIARYAGGKCNYDLIRMWIDESGATVDWLASYMAKYGYTHVAEYDVGDGTHGYFKVFPVHTKLLAGDNVTTGTADAIVAEAEALGATLRYDTSLIKFIKDASGKVTGVYAKNDKGYIKISVSKAVILCTGGYEGDAKLYTKLNPYAAGITTIIAGRSYNTGDGIKAAIWAGGRKQETAAVQLFDRGPVKPGDKAGYPFHSDEVMGPFWMGSQPFLKVNMKGKRFMNESAPYDWPLFAAGYQNGGVYCPIFDANYWDNIAGFHTIGCSRQIPSTTVPATGEGQGKANFDETLAQYIGAGIIQQADTIAELATKLGLPSAELVNTVNRFNTLAQNKNDTDYGKPAKDLFPVNTPPFYGYTLGGSLMCTEDGIIIDEHCRVIDSDNNPITGLYAAGNVSGGIFDTNYPELIVGLTCGRAMTQARHAVRHALGIIS
ncbi:FAD-binding protein [Geobacter sp. FeAm09]|uniref:FAD-dependent oxidoreductase n=1 Tax=Geobacter sp. FeAm09 TaxID=2597769 RepID=UPI0011ECBBAD|nr:FAD-binding protein [Geobacter sp. FeAm09]QEM68955.1 FAD-binding protein [Geobacter sp. FeAm09]